VKQKEEELAKMVEDGGGKQGKKPGFITVSESPIKKKGPHCKVHDFVPECNKQYARKGTGWCLDDIACEGFKKTCGKEFVERIEEAKLLGNGLVVSLRHPAYWCKVCHLVYCSECYRNMLQDDMAGSSGKLARRRL